MTTQHTPEQAAINSVDTLAAIKGQESGKRALIVAIAGNHSILFFGPPEVGKSMLRAVAADFGLTQTAESRHCPCGSRNNPSHAWDIMIEIPPAPAREMKSSLQGTSKTDVEEQIGAMSHHDSITLDIHAQSLLRHFIKKLGVTIQQRDRICHVARTIANLSNSKTIQTSHIMEAINYSVTIQTSHINRSIE